MRYLRQNTDQYISIDPFFDKTAGLGNEDGLTVTSFSGVIVVSTHSGASTHTPFTPSGTASNDWGMAAIGHGGIYDLKVPDSEINFVGSCKIAVWYDAEALPAWHEFMVIPANVWDSLMGTDLLDVNTAQWLGTACHTPDTAGVPLTDIHAIAAAVDLSTTMKASVNTEADAALSDINLDHLMKVAKETDWATTITKESVIDLMTSKDTSQTFSRLSDSLEAVRDRGDAAWLTGAGGASQASFTPTTVVRTIGDNDGGTQANVAVADGTTMDTGETSGTVLWPSGANGIDVLATFAATVGSFPVSLKVWARYVGSASHYINVHCYNYVAAAWEKVGEIPNGSAVQMYTFPLSSVRIKADGEMLVRFYHSDGTGVTNHSLHLDKVQVDVQLPFSGATPADVNAQILDVLNTDTFGEPAQGAPAATTTLINKIGFLYKFLRNKITQDATTLKVYNDAGDTVDQKATVSDDTTTFTRGEIGGGP